MNKMKKYEILIEQTSYKKATLFAYTEEEAISKLMDKDIDTMSVVKELENIVIDVSTPEENEEQKDDFND